MNGIYDIAEYGALPDGATPNTAAIQRAVDECHRAGGGRVVCGPGAWLTGSVELRSNVDLHLAPGCRIVGSPRLADYPALAADGFHPEFAPERSASALLRAIGAENVSVTGSGTVDGAGLAFYENVAAGGKLEKPPTPRPRIGMFLRCRNLRIEGVSLVDSACWTLWLMQCEGVAVSGVSIAGNRRMRNVDGIDLDCCRNATVTGCRFDTEDDCVVLRAIGRLYDEPAVCENVTVSDCVMATACQGVRVGCPGDGVIRNAAFTNLVIRSANNGILFENPRRYLPADRPGSADVSRISFSNCVIECGRMPVGIVIEEGIALPRLADLSFSNFTIRSGGPCVVRGSAETTIRDVRFSNVRIETTGDDAVVCRRCERVRLDNVELANRPAETPPGC